MSQPLTVNFQHIDYLFCLKLKTTAQKPTSRQRLSARDDEPNSAYKSGLFLERELLRIRNRRVLLGSKPDRWLLRFEAGLPGRQLHALHLVQSGTLFQHHIQAWAELPI